MIVVQHWNEKSQLPALSQTPYVISHNFASFHLKVTLLTLSSQVCSAQKPYTHTRAFNLKWIHHAEIYNSSVFSSCQNGGDCESAEAT